MKITPAQLELNGYSLADTLPHSEMMPFVKTYIRKPNIYGYGYYVLIFVQLIAAIGFFLHAYGLGQLHISEGISLLFFAFPLAFLLIPLHEYIHVLAYKSQGAQHTSYDVFWRKLLFLAVADQFVASKKEFRIVALAPFVSISVGLLLAISFTSGLTCYVLLCILFWHTSFCGGDFALLSYFDFHQHKEVVTYDDKQGKVSYFYTK